MSMKIITAAIAATLALGAFQSPAAFAHHKKPIVIGVGGNGGDNNSGNNSGNGGAGVHLKKLPSSGIIFGQGGNGGSNNSGNNSGNGGCGVC
jgi:hypothetical protein